MTDEATLFDTLKPITISPGGEVTGEDFFGRTRELDLLHEKMQHPKCSILIPGPRRRGKSSFVKEFFRRNPEITPLYLQLQSCQTIPAFYDAFVRKIDSRMPKALALKVGKKSAAFFNTVSELLPSLRYGEFELKTGRLDQAGIDTLFERMAGVMCGFPGRRIVLVLDEIADFLLDIRKAHGDHAAGQFLKWLRVVRQEHGVQMILTGSVNILWAMKMLRCEDLVGDMPPFPLPPMVPEESKILFLSLLKSCDLRLSGGALAFCLGRVGDGIPYFIQVLADAIRQQCRPGDALTDGEVMAGIYDRLVQADLPAFSQSFSRLDKYLAGPAEKSAAKKLLAHLAQQPMDIESLLALAGGSLAHDRDCFADLLQRLVVEGYLEEQDGCFSFASVFLADYWRKHYAHQR